MKSNKGFGFKGSSAVFSHPKLPPDVDLNTNEGVQRLKAMMPPGVNFNSHEETIEFLNSLDGPPRKRFH